MKLYQKITYTGLLLAGLAGLLGCGNPIMKEKGGTTLLVPLYDDKTVKEKDGTTLLVPLYDDKTMKEKDGTTLLVPLYDEKTR